MSLVVRWMLRLVAATGTAAACWIALAPLPSNAGRSDALPPAASGSVGRKTDVDSLADVLVDAAPFRAIRTPPDQGYLAQLVPVAAPPEVPQLTLRGLVLARSVPVAVVEGIPGTAGQVMVRAGDRPGDGSLTVQSIGLTSVSIVGRDTAWNLVLKGGRP